MRSTLSSSLHNEVTESSIAPSAGEMIKKRILELTAELQKVNAKLSNLAASFGKARTDGQKKTIKKNAVIYQRRKRTIEQRLLGLEARGFNTDQLAFENTNPLAAGSDEQKAKHPPSDLALCVVVGSDDTFDTDLLIQEMNATIDLLQNADIPRSEDDFAKEIAELDDILSKSTVSLDGIVPDFDEAALEEMHA